MNKLKKFFITNNLIDFWGTMVIFCGIGILINILLILVTYYFNLNNDITMLIQTMLVLIILGYMILVLFYILIKDIYILIKYIKKKLQKER